MQNANRKMMDTYILQPGDETKWDAFVTSSDHSTFYHLSGWKKIIAETFRHEPLYFQVSENDEIKGIMPLFICRLPFKQKMLVSLPYTNYGGICGEDDARQLLVEKAIAHARENNIGCVYIKNKYQQIPDFQSYEEYATVEMTLGSEEDDVWQTIGPKVRNQTRKAQTSGLSVDTGRNYLEEFYRVYAQNTRDLGSPAYGLSYFGNIMETFPDKSDILVVKYQGNVIGGIMLLWFKDVMCGPAASSLRKYFEMCPNNLLYWETLKYAVSKKMNVFDFGRSSRNTGPYRFKKQWGGQTRQVYYQFRFDKPQALPIADPDNFKYRLASTVWRKLPLTAANFLGPKIIRYLL